MRHTPVHTRICRRVLYPRRTRDSYQPHVRLFLIFATAFFLLVGCTAHGAQLYRWVDDKGTVHYSQHPPQQQTFQTLETTERAASQNADTADTGQAVAPHTPPDEAPKQERAHRRSFDHGLLWEISSNDSAMPSYLFGTIHSEDPRALQLSPEVQAAFDASDHFCMEVVFDARASLVLAQSMLFPNGQNLQTVLGRMLFNKIAVLMAEHGVPEHSLQHMKPWAVFTTLSSPKKKTGRFLDLVLYERATQQGKATCGLETAEEQVAIFNAASVDNQVILLRETVKQYPKLADFFDRLMDRYLARDLAGLVTLSEENSPTAVRVQHVYDAFMDRLLDQRNTRMLNRMTAKLQAGGAFIAVGALHLPGEQGLLQLLYQQGYALEAVY